MPVTSTLMALLVAGAALIVWNSSRIARRKFTAPVDVVARCTQGHLFTTIWIAGASFKSIRLGHLRYQYCPVGGHWSTVEPAPTGELSDAERIEAARFHDIRIP